MKWTISRCCLMLASIALGLHSPAICSAAPAAKGPAKPATAAPPAAGKAAPTAGGKPTTAKSGTTITDVKTAAGAKDKPVVRSLKIDPLDWPSWRGPEQNGISRETGLVDKFDPTKEENVLWRDKELAGISTPIVMHGHLYVVVRDQPETKNEAEKLVCVNADSGKKIWENRWNVVLTDVPAERIGWSACVGDPVTGLVYAQSASGFLICCDGETGQTVWSRPISEEYGVLSTYGGRTGFPVLFENLLIINSVLTSWGEQAKPAHRFLAMDKLTGEVLWFNGTKPLPEDTTYSTPTLTVLDGQAAMVFGSADGAVWAFQPRTGKDIWKYQVSRRGMSVSPLVVGDKIFMAQNEVNIDSNDLGCIVAIRGTGKGEITKTNTLWKFRGPTDGKSSPIMVDGRVYCADEQSNFYILDAETGKQVGKTVKLVGTQLRSSPVYADGKIYLCSTTGWHVMQPTADGVKFIDKKRLPFADEVSGSPIVSHGKIYLPTRAALYCLGAKGAKTGASEQPKAPVESFPGKGDAAAWVQITPTELLLKPGDKQQLTVRTFNARGQYLWDMKPADVKFAVEGAGQVDKNGVFSTSAESREHAAAIITATVGENSGTARLRIVPPLPWKFDFNDTPLVENPATKTKEGEAPVTWVGMRHRHKVREVDGNKLLVKISTIPKGTRSQGWMGPVTLHDYTIQTDQMGTVVAGQGDNKDSKLPDMGVIAQEYTLAIMGEDQQLQIRSWTSQYKTVFSKTIPFESKGNVWYTIKFQASRDGKTAVLKGKVWPRDAKEPTAWTIEATDPNGNMHGSPGLFGNATSSEIYIDNVLVTANK